MSRPLEIIAYAQAAYFAVTGIWPLVHVRSFMAVTGPKIDLWLVKTVGVLVTAVGVPIGLSAWNGRITPEVVALAVGSAAALGAVDVVYVLKRVIAKIYLLDAIAEAILILAWILAWHRG